MLKSISATIIFLTASSLPSSAELLFRGELIITSATSDCKTFVKKGDLFRSEFHPLAVNNNFAGITIFSTFSAIGYELPKILSTSYQKVTSQAVAWHGYTPPRPTYILGTREPDTITATMPTVVLKGKIKNLWGDIGYERCVADFVASYVRFSP